MSRAGGVGTSFRMQLLSANFEAFWDSRLMVLRSWAVGLSWSGAAGLRTGAL